MSIANILSPNNYHIYANNINSSIDKVNDIWVENINGSPYPPGGGAVPSLVSNKFLRTTSSVSPTMFWGDVNAAELVHGTANQILHTNSSGTASEWTSNITIPGAFTSVGNGLFQQDLAVNNECNVTGDLTVINGDLEVTTGHANFNGDLQFNSSSGTTGQYLVKTGATTQTWTSPPNVKLVRFVAYFAAQDLNAGLTGVATFNNTNIISNLASGSVSAVTGISMSSTTEFLIGTTGIYDIDITGFISTTSAGIGTSTVSLFAEVAGFGITRNCICNNNSYSFCGKIPSVSITAGQILRILTQRVNGTDALSTNAPFLLPTSFPSTIAISLVNIV